MFGAYGSVRAVVFSYGRVTASVSYPVDPTPPVSASLEFSPLRDGHFVILVYLTPRGHDLVYVLIRVDVDRFGPHEPVRCDFVKGPPVADFFALPFAFLSMCSCESCLHSFLVSEQDNPALLTENPRNIRLCTSMSVF